MPRLTDPASRYEKAVPRQQYRLPPVHEVILDVQFSRSIKDEHLREIQTRLSEHFESVQQQNVVQLQLGVGPEGQGFQNAASQFAGWLCSSHVKDWVFQAGLAAYTLHAVRPGPWPTGSYVGWGTIFARFQELHERLSDAYGGLEPKRVGLRYLNRIAIPAADDISSWFQFSVRAPGCLHELYTFNIRQTWARAGDNADISASVGLAKIEIGDPVVATANQGILLDIDVFNLGIERAPTYDSLAEWFDRAHDVENDIFEGCISPALRTRFSSE